MNTLLQLLLEYPLTSKYAKDMIKRNQIVSLFYNKKWIKVEPVRIVTDNNISYLVGYEVGQPDELRSYEFTKINNWNVVSRAPATRAKAEIEREKKAGKKKEPEKPEEPTKPITPGINSPGGNDLPSKIVDSITNKRVSKIYYKGYKEEPAGTRYIIPTYYGKVTKANKETSSVMLTPGQNYVRAYVLRGSKSVSANKDPQNKSLSGWRLFREDRIGSWENVGTKTFDRPPENYRPGDKMVDNPISQAVFTQKEGVEKINESVIINAIFDVIRII
jgi:hypothetical protein